MLINNTKDIHKKRPRIEAFFILIDKPIYISIF